MIPAAEIFGSLRKATDVYYGRLLVGVAAFVMILGIVPLFHGVTAWFVVLEQHFQWNRTQLSLAFSLARVEGGIMGPLEGLLVDRLGPRRMVLIGLLIMGGGFLLFSQVQELWQFYAAFLIMSLGGSLGTFLPMMTAINSWFVRRRAMAMSRVLVGYKLGAIALVPLLAWAVGVDQFGWRAVAAGIGGMVIVLAYPLSRLVRNRPEDYGLRPDGQSAAPQLQSPAATPADTENREFTLRQAIRTRAFWQISFGHACCSSIVVTIMVHLGPMLTDQGFSLQTVGFVVSVYTAIGVASIMVGGYLGDRVPIRLGIFGFSLFQSIAIIILLLAHSLPMVFLFSVLMGIGEGRGSLTTAIRGVYFGRKAFASIMGISMVPMNVLLFTLPLFAGYMFDQRGSYAIPFTTIAAVGGIGATLFLFLGEPKTIAPPALAPRVSPT